MPKMIYVAIFIGFVAILALCARADIIEQRKTIDPAKLLAAIGMVEDWKGKDGADGEKGPYQLTRAVWARFTLDEFTDKNVREQGHDIAMLHVDWLIINIRKLGLQPTAFNVALCYNAGFTAFKNNTYSGRKADYAKRVQNIYLSNL